MSSRLCDKLQRALLQVGHRPCCDVFLRIFLPETFHRQLERRLRPTIISHTLSLLVLGSLVLARRNPGCGASTLMGALRPVRSTHRRLPRVNGQRSAAAAQDHTGGRLVQRVLGRTRGRRCRPSTGEAATT